MSTRTRNEPKTTQPDDAPGGVENRTMLFARRRPTARNAREFVAETLSQWDLTERLDDVRLCVSELVTNALRHGAPAGHLILVRLELHDAQLLVEVHDSGGGTPRQREAPESSEEGRGLFLVSAIADDWGVTTRQGPGKRVWASFQRKAVTTC
ncbi:ATP-binding protein [Streptomyces sp. NBC_01210]|uniref:ATP-binding protein n=1 Tax=Streptomyces sp. NBC_01210 TaxID=2903774 RepID=UPI002E0D1C01|nr:ATP-binding protein [Streptomyces sp. NBC_01210]